MTGRRFSIAALLLAGGCAARAVPAGSSLREGSIDFGIVAGFGSAGPFWVAVNGSAGETGWLHATLDGAPVYLQERCDIPDCNTRPVVCGAAIPYVRDLTASSGRRIDFLWDGMISTVDPVSACELRRPAPPGNYRARFCWSREAVLDTDGDPARGAAGHLVNAVCVERAFTLTAREVIVRP